MFYAYHILLYIIYVARMTYILRVYIQLYSYLTTNTFYGGILNFEIFLYRSLIAQNRFVLLYHNNVKSIKLN